MNPNLIKLLFEGKTYLWALRHSQQLGLTEEKIREARDVLAADGIDLMTLVALKNLEYPIARFPYPSHSTP